MRRHDAEKPNYRHRLLRARRKRPRRRRAAEKRDELAPPREPLLCQGRYLTTLNESRCAAHKLCAGSDAWVNRDRLDGGSAVSAFPPFATKSVRTTNATSGQYRPKCVAEKSPPTREVLLCACPAISCARCSGVIFRRRPGQGRSRRESQPARRQHYRRHPVILRSDAEARLGLLGELVPKATVITFLLNPTNLAAKSQIQGVQEAVRSRGL